MNGRVLEMSLLGAVVLGVAAAVRVAGWPLAHTPRPPDAVLAEPRLAPASPASDDASVGLIVARDPFRVTRRPAAVAYDPLRVGQPPAPQALKPVLALVGIVWDGGRDPVALIEGLPGVDGLRVVRVGEMVGGLKVKRIAQGDVMIVGLDTVWTLKVREPWR